MLGHSLIMWDSVRPSIDWVQQHIPKVSFCLLYVYLCHNYVLTIEDYLIAMYLSSLLFKNWFMLTFTLSQHQILFS